MDAPRRWGELNPDQRTLVNRYIDTLLHRQLEIPLQHNKSREVVEREFKDGISYQLEMVRCGKSSCRSCPHGPYWYAYWRKRHGKIVSKYIGKELKRLT